MLISNYAIKFRVAVYVLAVVLIMAGVGNYLSLPREGAPDITIPFVFVSSFYEGTAPSEMEKLVTIPLEKSLNTVESIKEIRSTTRESVSSIAIEFVAGEDIDMARQRVKDKVDLAKPDLPADLDEPVVYAFNFSSDSPIFIFALSGNLDEARLKNTAEELESEIERLTGVKEVGIAGTREREIRVEFDLGRLAAYDLPTDLVLARIAAENRTVSAGNIEMDGNRFQVRVPGEFAVATHLRDILLAERDGQAIFLRDVATVSDAYKDIESLSRLNGTPCVSLSVKKRSGENSVALIGEIKAILARFNLPAGVAMTVVMDQSDYVSMMIGELENNIASGFLLVVAVLLVFMGARNSIFVGLAIPFSMLVAFTAMAMMGFSLNMIVLFSLVLSVGMLVDNAIVIVENTYRIHNEGVSRMEAARRGAAEVAWPVITSTLTTLAAFAPLLFWPDIMGQFMGFMPRTLIVTLTASLFVAIVVNPAVCSAFIKRGGGAARGDGQPRRSHPILTYYERFLRAAIAHRWAVVLIAVCGLVVTVQIYARHGRGIELFPDTDPRNATIDVRLPQGASIERTDAIMRTIEAKLPKYGDIKFFLTTVGGTVGTHMAQTSGTHMGQIYIEFKEMSLRSTNSTELVAVIRKDVGVMPGAEIKVDKQEEGPPTGAPVSIEVSGDDFDTLSEATARIVRAIETTPGLVDLQDDFEEALPELRATVDRQRAALFGLDTAGVGNFLRTAIYGSESSKFRADEDEFDITVRLPLDQRDTADVLSALQIPVPGGGSVPLTTVATVTYEGGLGAITRKNQKRVITISGNNQGRGVDKILEDIRPRVDKVSLPRGYSVSYAGENKDMIESGAFLKRAFLIALGLILTVLVLQFNSVVLPVIIVTSVILSIAGVLWGLLICGMRFGVIMTGLGVISLAGIVVNNAIVLVDCIRQREEEGLSLVDAAVAAGRLRLRPVLLTALTTVLGLIPMAVGYSLEIHTWPPRIVAGAESSAWWAPMAVAVIFGLSVATVLTLVLIPVMYTIAGHARARLARRFSLDPER